MEVLRVTVVLELGDQNRKGEVIRHDMTPVHVLQVLLAFRVESGLETTIDEGVESDDTRLQSLFFHKREPMTSISWTALDQDIDGDLI